MRGDLAQQVGRVAGLGDDLEAGVAEQPHDALAQQRLVLADDDPILMAVPATLRAAATRVRPSARTRAPRSASTSPIAAASSVETSTTAGPSQARRRGHPVAVGQVDVHQHAVRPQLVGRGDADAMSPATPTTS